MAAEAEILTVDGVKIMKVAIVDFRTHMANVLERLERGEVDVVHLMNRGRLQAVVQTPPKQVLPDGLISLR